MSHSREALSGEIGIEPLSLGSISTLLQNDNVFWFLVLLVSGLVLVGIPVAFQALALRRLRREGEAGLVSGKLEGLELDEGETLILQTIAQYCGESLARCVQMVEVFDRGVDGLLVQSTRLSSIQRVDLLRTVRSLRRRLGFDSTAPYRILQSTRTLPIGQQVTISPADPDDEPDASRDGVVSGSIHHVDDECITVRLDPPGRSSSEFVPGTVSGNEVDVHFYRQDDCAYSFRSVVLEFRDHGPGILRLAHPPKLFRQQRRNFLRVDTEEEIHFRWFPAIFERKQSGLEGDLKPVMEIHKGVLTNLSGGGMQLSVPNLRIGKEDWIEVHFPFLPSPMDREYCIARVVQVHNPPDAGLYGLKFEKPSVRLQTAILREVERRHRAFHARTVTEEIGAR